MNFRERHISMQLQWVSTVESKSEFDYAYEELVREIRGTIWQCNLRKKELEGLFRPSFWRDLLSTWVEITAHEPQNQEEVLNQVIWYNHYVQRGGR